MCKFLRIPTLHQGSIFQRAAEASEQNRPRAVGRRRMATYVTTSSACEAIRPSFMDKAAREWKSRKIRPASKLK